MIYLLQRKEAPWESVAAMVVRANTMELARREANRSHGEAWLDEEQTSCERLWPYGPPEIMYASYFGG